MGLGFLYLLWQSLATLAEALLINRIAAQLALLAQVLFLVLIICAILRAFGVRNIDKVLALGIGLAVAALGWYVGLRPIVVPAPMAVPNAPELPKRKPLLPWRQQAEEFAAVVGGKVAPDGSDIDCDLPESQQKRNISSRGQGCCVFRSTDHMAHWANVEALYGFPEWLQSKGLTGGGSWVNVPPRIKQICQERGMPEPVYVQVHSPNYKDDLEVLSAALASGRMAAITYGYSPTPGRYKGQIAHMVNLVSAPHDDGKGNRSGSWCVLDNNYIGTKNLEWLNDKEFTKAYTSGGKSGWAVILLDPGPPPLPYN